MVALAPGRAPSGRPAGDDRARARAGLLLRGPRRDGRDHRAGRRPRSRHPRPPPPPLGFHRQRRLAGPRPALGRRAGRRRRGDDPRRGRGRGRGRPEGPAADRRGPRPRRSAPTPRPGRPGDEGPAPPARRAEPRNARAQGRVRRRRARRPPPRREEPRQGADRGLHDRGQRGDREVPRRAWPSLAAAGSPCARALGAHRRACGRRGERLPPAPDARSLEVFLAARRQADPARFADLSLSVVKLLGSGEYVLDPPGGVPDGHFGLALRDYTHSTAPNRRFPDLITQRLLKAALAGRAAPYTDTELTELARRCTQQEDSAAKVERQVRKSAAALLLEARIGERFDAIVTGSSAKGTWVRVLRPPVEGMVVRGAQGLDVGDRVRVELLRTDIERGFIDFARAT